MFFLQLIQGFIIGWMQQNIADYIELEEPPSVGPYLESVSETVLQLLTLSTSILTPIVP